jgi:hypothetical protein
LNIPGIPHRFDSHPRLQISYSLNPISSRPRVQAHAHIVRPFLGNTVARDPSVYAEAAQQVADTLEGVPDPCGAFLVLLDVLKVGDEFRAHVIQ